ncbi:MAG TPA: GGDEF domain-containing protein [Thermoanaerobaculia bacterium]|nr:GGDEF domain-containing protein [Thermoanaerobaculia bacterium]
MDAASLLVSQVAVTAHVVCLLLLALTFTYLARLFPWVYLKHWSIAWWSLLLAVGAVRLSISWPAHSLWGIYLAAEWVFLFFLLAGCRELATGHTVPLRRFLPALPGSLLIAASGVPFFASFNRLFALQAAVMAAGFVTTLALLRPVSAPHRTVGFRLMQAALVFLSLLFIAYVPLFYLVEHPYRFPWLSYSSLADLFGQLLLAFGMVFVVSEEARRELTEALTEVRRARDQIERQSRLDPLTETLNRHAFQSILKGEGMDPTMRRGRGTVIMVDLDHLKAINDSGGHPLGDAAIQAAARAIRGLIRAEDLLFRWGGDEFLVLLPALERPKAEERFRSLERGVAFRIQPEQEERTLQLSWGIAEFGGRTTIQEAIALADAAMYERRAGRRTTPSPATDPLPRV